MSQRAPAAGAGDEPPNTARVRRALAIIRPHLDAHVRQTLARVPGARVSATADVHELLKAMVTNPVHFFAGHAGDALRASVQVLRDARNRVAHDRPFTDREARQVVETAAIVAESIGAPREIVTSLDALSTRATAAPTTGRLAGGTPRSGGTQRDVMRAIWARCAPDAERTVREYAAAEARGESRRRNNASDHSPEQYARALLADGLRKGWLSRDV